MQTKHYKNLLEQAKKLYRHNRQGSYRTRQRYFEAFQRFLQYLADIYHLQKIKNISGKHMASYVSHMQNKNLAPSTIKCDLSAIRFWCNMIPDAKYVLPSNDEFNLERRKFGGTDRAWSDGEFERMLSECKKCGRDDFRVCVIIARYMGLRIHEIMRIDTAIARAALKNGYIAIRGKGGLHRTVPLHENVRPEFEELLKTTQAGHKLFVPEGKETHIAITELQNFINTHRKSVQDSGSTRPMTMHGLRHRFAAETYQALIDEGKSEYEARLRTSNILGHRRADVTRIYLASLDNDEKDGNRDGYGNV